MSEDFGSYLKHERELRGVPLEDIAQSTKISINFLRAIEAGRFEDLPGEVFIKGFIRSYGQAIGLNVDELLAAYHESGNKGQDTATAQATISSPSDEEQSERHSGFPIKAVLGIVVALLIIAGGIYWFIFEKGDNARQSQQTPLATLSTIDNSLPEVEGDAESTVSEEVGTSLSGEENPNSEPSQTDTTGLSEPTIKESPAETSAEDTRISSPIKNTVTVSENDAIIRDLKNQAIPELIDSTDTAMGDSSLKLVIRVNENSWFNLRVDDQRDQDFILPPGGSKMIQAKNAIVITIGNRRATQMDLNGQQLNLPESSDNVIRNLTVNAEQLN
jgi:cytoskeleton protein RodZ